MDGPGNCSIPGGLPESEEERQAKKRFLGPSPSPRGNAGEVLLENVDATPVKRANFPLCYLLLPPYHCSAFCISVTPGQPQSENSRNK